MTATHHSSPQIYAEPAFADAAAPLIRQTPGQASQALIAHDLLLAARCAAGDEIARTKLVLHCDPSLRAGVAAVLTQTRPGQQHDEAAQEARIALLGAVRKYRGKCSLKTFARRVATFVAIRYLQIERRQPHRAMTFDGLASEGDGFGSLASQAPDPEREAAARELLMHIYLNSTAVLTEQQLRVFSLSAVEGLSNQQIAEALSRSEGQIRVVLNHLRKRLRGLLPS